MTTAARARLHLENGDELKLWFNPSALRRGRRAEFDKSGSVGQAAPTLQYLRTRAESLSIDVLLHAQGSTPTSAVKQAIDRLEGLVEPTVEVPDTSQQRPQKLWFEWGDYMSPASYCESVGTTIELFEADGTPLRAIVSLLLTQAEPQLPDRGQNPTTRATQRRRSHLVHGGDTLAGIAYAHYGDPAHWRAIAEANGIDDPLRLPVGSRLTVPLEAA